MAKLVQQSTTGDPLFFFLTASSDHITGLTGASPTVNISKNGAAGVTPSGAISQVDSTNLPGWYQVAGNATDTNTLGDILLHATAASADPCDMVVAQVVAFNPRNANLDLSNVSANVAQWNGTNVAAPATAGIPDINVKNYNNQTAATDANNLPKVDVEDIGGVVLSTHAAGMMPSDVRDIVGAAVSTSTAQLGVNAVNIGGAAAQLDANNLLKVDMEDVGGVVLSTHTAGMVPSDLRNISGAAISTTTAQVGANVVQYNGQTAQTDANNLPKVDIEDVAGNATAGANMSKTNQATCRGTVGSASTTTSIVTSAFSPAGVASGQFNGRTVIFDANTATASLQGQATNITASTGAANPTLTVTALTTAPVSGDTFSVV